MEINSIKFTSLCFTSLSLDLDIGSVSKTLLHYSRIITSVARVIILRSNRRGCPRSSNRRGHKWSQSTPRRRHQTTSSTQAGYSEESTHRVEEPTRRRASARQWWQRWDLKPTPPHHDGRSNHTTTLEAQDSNQDNIGPGDQINIINNNNNQRRYTEAGSRWHS